MTSHDITVTTMNTVIKYSLHVPVKSRKVKKVTDNDITLTRLVILLKWDCINPEDVKSKTGYKKCGEHHHE